MKAVILCGGQWTHIRDGADDIFTPMIRIGVLPILRHILSCHRDHRCRAVPCQVLRLNR